MKFTKMHGIGNDYVYVNCFREKVENPEEVAKFVSDRHFGIGSDGLILIKPSDVADCEMEMYNADGSRGKMCGNGIRCVAKYVYDYGITDKTQISVATGSGIKYLDGIPAGGFEFQLIDANGAVIETVKSGADGSFVFTELPFTAAGTYLYTVKEVIGTDEDIWYDESGREQYFDLSSDPNELHDRIDDPACAERVDVMTKGRMISTEISAKIAQLITASAVPVPAVRSASSVSPCA